MSQPVSRQPVDLDAAEWALRNGSRMGRGGWIALVRPLIAELRRYQETLRMEQAEHRSTQAELRASRKEIAVLRALDMTTTAEQWEGAYMAAKNELAASRKVVEAAGERKRIAALQPRKTDAQMEAEFEELRKEFGNGESEEADGTPEGAWFWDYQHAIATEDAALAELEALK